MKPTVSGRAGKLMWAVIYPPSCDVCCYVYHDEAKAIDHATDDPWKPKVRCVRIHEISKRKARR